MQEPRHFVEMIPLYGSAFAITFSADFINSRLKRRSTRSVSLWMFGYNSAKSSQTDWRKSDIPLRIRFTRFFLPVFTDMFCIISGMSFSQNDAIKILDRSVILLHTCSRITSAHTLLSRNITVTQNFTDAWCGTKFLPLHCFYSSSCGYASSVKTSKYYLSYHTYIDEQHCTSLSNQHISDLEASLRSFLFVQKQLRYSQRHNTMHSLAVLESFS